MEDSRSSAEDSAGNQGWFVNTQKNGLPPVVRKSAGLAGSLVLPKHGDSIERSGFDEMEQAEKLRELERDMQLLYEEHERETARLDSGIHFSSSYATNDSSSSDDDNKDIVQSSSSKLSVSKKPASALAVQSVQVGHQQKQTVEEGLKEQNVQQKQTVTVEGGHLDHPVDESSQSILNIVNTNGHSTGGQTANRDNGEKLSPLGTFAVIQDGEKRASPSRSWLASSSIEDLLKRAEKASVGQSGSLYRREAPSHDQSVDGKEDNLQRYGDMKPSRGKGLMRGDSRDENQLADQKKFRDERKLNETGTVKDERPLSDNRGLAEDRLLMSLNSSSRSSARSDHQADTRTSSPVPSITPSNSSSLTPHTYLPSTRSRASSGRNSVTGDISVGGDARVWARQGPQNTRDFAAPGDVSAFKAVSSTTNNSESLHLSPQIAHSRGTRCSRTPLSTAGEHKAGGVPLGTSKAEADPFPQAMATADLPSGRLGDVAQGTLKADSLPVQKDDSQMQCDLKMQPRRRGIEAPNATSMEPPHVHRAVDVGGAASGYIEEGSPDREGRGRGGVGGEVGEASGENAKGQSRMGMGLGKILREVWMGCSAARTKDGSSNVAGWCVTKRDSGRDEDAGGQGQHEAVQVSAAQKAGDPNLHLSHGQHVGRVLEVRIPLSKHGWHALKARKGVEDGENCTVLESIAKTAGLDAAYIVGSEAVLRGVPDCVQYAQDLVEASANHMSHMQYQPRSDPAAGTSAGTAANRRENTSSNERSRDHTAKADTRQQPDDNAKSTQHLPSATSVTEHPAAENIHQSPVAVFNRPRGSISVSENAGQVRVWSAEAGSQKHMIEKNQVVPAHCLQAMCDSKSSDTSAEAATDKQIVQQVQFSQRRPHTPPRGRNIHPRPNPDCYGRTSSARSSMYGDSPRVFGDASVEDDGRDGDNQAVHSRFEKSKNGRIRGLEDLRFNFGPLDTF